MTDRRRTDQPRQRDLKLELTWVGKDHRPRLEPRILLEDPEKNYHAAARVTDHDQFENMLIFGDNLLALKALATDDKVRGKVKCIFIDPPYNTGSAFEHYDDGMEHSLWLGMMRERLELLRELLSEDGSIWISIDDNEMPYLRLLMDEIFGRGNFVASIVWQKRYSRENRSAIGDAHDYIIVYAADSLVFKNTRNKTSMSEEQAKVYKNPNGDPRGPWRGIPMTAQGYRPNQMYKITTPSGAVHYPPEGRCWSTIETEYVKLRESGRIYFGKNDDAQPSIIRYLTEVEGVTPWTWWTHDESGHNDEAKKESHELFGRENAFSTPKPERLLRRIIEIATNSNDIVLDSFAGSGTTGAVAHKMGRRWIMVELGEHAHTHIIPRLQKVIDGSDQGGITQAVGWKGGGGFRYYKLAPSLIKYDKRGHEIINPEYNPEMLAEACCKLQGYAFDPATSRELWWQQGRSSERSFLYVTTQYLDYAALQELSEEVGPERTLLVLAKAYDRGGDVFDNLTVEKIPDRLLHLAEWDHDDYSLNVENLPKAEPQQDARGLEPVAAGGRGRRAKSTEPGLFDLAGGEV